MPAASGPHITIGGGPASSSDDDGIVDAWGYIENSRNLTANSSDRRRQFPASGTVRRDGSMVTVYRYDKGLHGAGIREIQCRARTWSFCRACDAPKRHQIRTGGNLLVGDEANTKRSKNG